MESRPLASRCTRESVSQAEDGIRDYKVTGVQTCALPSSENAADEVSTVAFSGHRDHGMVSLGAESCCSLVCAVASVRASSLVEITRMAKTSLPRAKANRSP